MASLIHEPQRPRKPWRVDWHERRRHRTRRFATRREAERFIGDLARGARSIDPSRLTLRDWWRRWLVEHGIEWAPRTRRDRAWYGDRHILPGLGELLLHEIGRQDVRSWRAQLAAGGASAYTVNTATTILSAALGDAVEDGHLFSNPALGFRKLRRVVDPVRPPAVLSVEEVRQRLQEPRDRLVVSLLAYAGLRPGEVCALTWDQLAAVAAGGAEVAPRLLVSRSRGVGGIKATKTGASRLVTLRTPVLDDLTAVRAPSGPPDGLPVVAGGWDNWTGRVWRPACAAAGHRIRPYDLRHLCASLLIAEGRLSLPEIAAHMGHSLQMLTRTYAHVIEGSRGGAGRPLDEVVLEARQVASSMIQ